MRLVIALGGNALLRRGESADAVTQREHVRTAAGQLAPLTMDHGLVICHGNGPQVGLLAKESEDDASLQAPYPLDDLGAETQGLVGYWLTQALVNGGSARPVVAIITRVVVDPGDAAFRNPTKFVGRTYDADEALALIATRGWTLHKDGRDWRRVVPSPNPISILELDTISQLLHDRPRPQSGPPLADCPGDAWTGHVVVCGGGGGVPVRERPTSTSRSLGKEAHEQSSALNYVGAEAVVDKDATASLMAISLDADRLVLLTDVSAVKASFGTADEHDIHTMSVRDAEDLSLPEGSMAPKVRACVRFVHATGRPAHIGSLDDAAAVVAGRSGTTIVGETLRPSTPARYDDQPSDRATQQGAGPV